MSLEIVEGGCSEEVAVSEEVVNEEAFNGVEINSTKLNVLSEKLFHAIAYEVGADFLEEVVQVTSEVANKLTLAMNKFIEEQKLIPENLGYAIAAVKDFTHFMHIIALGKEVFHNPPPKVELSAEDTEITHEYVITLPVRLDDLRYMGEWFNKFFFPNTRPLIKTEGELSVEGFGNPETGIVEGVRLYFTPKEGTTFEVCSLLAGFKMNLVEFANTIDTHVAK